MYYPRSFLKFILLGFLLVSLPLVYALVELILSLDRLATQSRQEVLQASQAGRSSRLLFEQATTLERIARQEIILEDPALLDDYGAHAPGIPATTQQLSQLPLDRRSSSPRSSSCASAKAKLFQRPGPAAAHARHQSPSSPTVTRRSSSRRRAC